MERKVGSGRKGTVDEEEYLLKSLTKLAGRLAIAQGVLRDAPFGTARRSFFFFFLLNVTARVYP